MIRLKRGIQIARTCTNFRILHQSVQIFTMEKIKVSPRLNAVCHYLFTLLYGFLVQDGSKFRVFGGKFSGFGKKMSRVSQNNKR